MVDNEHGDGMLLQFQPQAELAMQRFNESESAIRVCSEAVDGGRRSPKQMRRVPVQREIQPPSRPVASITGWRMYAPAHGCSFSDNCAIVVFRQEMANTGTLARLPSGWSSESLHAERFDRSA